jgi:hypothetical protein
MSFAEVAASPLEHTHPLERRPLPRTASRLFPIPACRPGGSLLLVIRTPIRSPKANAFAEQWVRTARRECLDHLLILGRRHPERLLREFAGHCNAERPHREGRLARPSPVTSSSSVSSGAIRRRDRLGGMIHEYHREVA